MRILVAFMFALSSITVLAEETICSTQIIPGYSSIPRVAKPPPKIIKQLAAKRLYIVVKQSQDWVLVREQTLQLWAERKKFGDANTCPIESATIKNNGVSSRPYRSRASPQTPSGSSCSCGSGNVCHGPRGGRYCVSPNGSKRYGV